MTDLTSLTLADARERLRKKEITALELTDAHIDAVEAAQALNAYVRETPEHARAMARASDARLAKGAGGPLEGRSGTYDQQQHDHRRHDHHVAAEFPSTRIFAGQIFGAGDRAGPGA